MISRLARSLIFTASVVVVTVVRQGSDSFWSQHHLLHVGGRLFATGLYAPDFAQALLSVANDTYDTLWPALELASDVGKSCLDSARKLKLPDLKQQGKELVLLRRRIRLGWEQIMSLAMLPCLVSLTILCAMDTWALTKAGPACPVDGASGAGVGAGIGEIGPGPEAESGPSAFQGRWVVDAVIETTYAVRSPCDCAR